jgi:hypothetical protein
MSLIREVVDSVSGGTLLSEALYRKILDHTPASLCEAEAEAVALAVRQLGEFCDWSDFRWAEEQLRAGVDVDELHVGVERYLAEREALLWGPECDAQLDSIVSGIVQTVESERHFRKELREAEICRGFDEETTNELMRTLGSWDNVAIPKNVVDLLPEEIVFPIRTVQRNCPYDHRIHLMVRELLTRLSNSGSPSDNVIKHCGHIVADLWHSEDDESAFRLVLKQVIMLADEYVRRAPSDVIGLCWRGELACWDWDNDLAKDYAEKVWSQTLACSADEMSKVAAFFALTRELGADWGHCSDPDRFNSGSHLGELQSKWLDLEQGLAPALVRRTFRHCKWGTPLICSAFALQERGYTLEPDDVPLKCWVWMAENVERSNFGNEHYYTCWYRTFQSLASDTDPRLAHNVLVVLLAGLILDTFTTYDIPSVEKVLSRLADVYRADPRTLRKEAILGMVKFLYDRTSLDHLKAADIPAITKAIHELPEEPAGAPWAEPLPMDAMNEPDYEVWLDKVEAKLKPQIGEPTWSELSSEAKDHFKRGELQFTLALAAKTEVGSYFDDFVINYSKGLLAIIGESLRVPLLKGKSHKREFEKQFPDAFARRRHPEWAELLRLIDDREVFVKKSLGKALMVQRVAFHKFERLKDFFINMLRWRNQAAHSGKAVKRHEAELLHKLALDQGMIKLVVKCFPKPRKY